MAFFDTSISSVNESITSWMTFYVHLAQRDVHMHILFTCMVLLMMHPIQQNHH